MASGYTSGCAPYLPAGAASSPPTLAVTSASQQDTRALVTETATASNGTAPFTYAWTLVDPDGASRTALFSSATNVAPTWTPDFGGVWILECTATDAASNTAHASRTVEIGIDRWVNEGIDTFTLEQNDAMVTGRAATSIDIDAGGIAQTSPSVCAMTLTIPITLTGEGLLSLAMESSDDPLEQDGALVGIGYTNNGADLDAGDPMGWIAIRRPTSGNPTIRHDDGGSSGNGSADATLSGVRIYSRVGNDEYAVLFWTGVSTDGSRASGDDAVDHAQVTGSFTGTKFLMVVGRTGTISAVTWEGKFWWRWGPDAI